MSYKHDIAVSMNSVGYQIFFRVLEMERKVASAVHKYMWMCWGALSIWVDIRTAALCSALIHY